MSDAREPEDVGQLQRAARALRPRDVDEFAAREPYGLVAGALDGLDDMQGPHPLVRGGRE